MAGGVEVGDWRVTVRGRGCPRSLPTAAATAAATTHPPAHPNHPQRRQGRHATKRGLKVHRSHCLIACRRQRRHPGEPQRLQCVLIISLFCLLSLPADDKDNILANADWVEKDDAGWEGELNEVLADLNGADDDTTDGALWPLGVADCTCGCLPACLPACQSRPT